MTSSSESGVVPSDFREVYLAYDESTEKAHKVSEEYRDLYQSAMAQHEDNIKTIKNIYTKEISKRNTAIKVITVALLIVTGCAIYLAVELIYCKKA
jgi:hypothetical protein